MAEEPASPSLTPQGILETVLYCDDLEAAEVFYAQVLGLELAFKEAGRHVFFRCGTGMLLLFNPAATATVPTTINDQPIPFHGTRGTGHMAFRDSHERLEAWTAHLACHNVVIDSDVRWPNGARSLYFQDPAGNCLEIATPDLWGFSS